MLKLRGNVSGRKNEKLTREENFQGDEEQKTRRQFRYGDETKEERRIGVGMGVKNTQETMRKIKH